MTMFVDLTALAQDADAKEFQAMDRVAESVDAAFDSCHTLLAHLTQASEFVDVGACVGCDFDTVTSEILAGLQEIGKAQSALLRAVTALHEASAAINASATIEHLQVENPACVS